MHAITSFSRDVRRIEDCELLLAGVHGIIAVTCASVLVATTFVDSWKWL